VNVTALLSKLGPEARPSKTALGWQCRCPAHDDSTPSLSISETSDGKILLHCHAGCTIENICAKLNLTLADLFPPKDTRNGAARIPQLIQSYDYVSETGELIFQVCRFEPKTFKQRHPDRAKPGAWVWNMEGIDRVLYRLPDVLKAKAGGKPVFIAEGEKDCECLAKQGFTATTNSGGACKWQDSYSETLRGADVVIIADKDKAGREHAQLVAGKLHDVANSVRLLELPDTNGKAVKDAADFFNAGGDAEKIISLVDRTPEWTPSVKIQVSESGESTADIRGEILRLLLDGELSFTEKRTQIANAVVNALAGRGRFFFHAERKDFNSAMFFDGERKRLLRIRADAFGAWLADWLAVNRADSVFKFISAQVETVALAGSQTTAILPETFWASRPGTIYLSNGDGRMAKITPGNVQLVDNGCDGILFAAGNTLNPWTLTEPQDPFAICSLFSGANCAAVHGLDLLRLWILSLPTNPASKPPLCLAGDVGSGKTRLSKGVAELYGLPFVANAIEDFGEDSFWASLDGGGLFTCDNCDTRNKWLADAVASASTDGCSQRRKLYTDAERVTLRARAWLALTTANPTFASDSGLADRLLLVRMNRRTDETSDAKLSDEIREHRDAGLSFIVRTLATALADTERTPTGLNQRHPDFAAFAVRVGRAIGREAESVHALRTAEHDKSIFCLENDAIATALLTFIANAGQFTGAASELREKLIETDTDLAEKLSVKRLGRRIQMLWPHLEKVLHAKQEKDRNHFTIYTLKVRSAESAESQTAFH
jgi:5S rRNA maturation endonuclease (ribonuclease M5)